VSDDEQRGRSKLNVRLGARRRQASGGTTKKIEE
jgi:hypothetical protein